jgi:hypothetical protein
MKCEICKTIESLGLDPNAHDNWICADAKSPRLVLKKAQIAIHHFCLQVSAFFQVKWQHAGQMAYQRVRLLTLGL